MDRAIISFIGKKRTGKDTSYKLLLPYLENPEEFNFADPLKKFCMETLGLTYSQCYGSNEDRESYTRYRWEDIDPKIRDKNGNPTGFLTSRQVLQLVGTDLFRSQFYPNLWAEAAIRNAYNSKAKIVCLTDGRFPNEMHSAYYANEVVEDQVYGKSILIKLYRDTGFFDIHESEIALDFTCPVFRTGSPVKEIPSSLLNELGYQPTYIEGLYEANKPIKIFMSERDYCNFYGQTIDNKRDPHYHYLVDNNSTIDDLKTKLLYILKKENLYKEPDLS